MNDLAAWPALVLTAGHALRLRPLSAVRAKAAMPVAGRPIIARILAWLRAAGVRRVVLNLHHRADTITRIVGDGEAWDLQVRYSWESAVLGTAGGPRRALPLLEADRFLIINGDTLTDCDLGALAGHHRRSGARVTMALARGDTRRYGGVEVGPGGSVAGFVRAAAAAGAPGGAGHPGGATRSLLHFIGVQAVEADVFADVPDDRPTETVRWLYPRLIAARAGSITAFASAASFLDVGTPADYLRTVEDVAARERQPFDRGEGCHIAADAVLERTVLWDRVRIGRGAHLSGCIVADDVVIPDGARHERSVLVASPGGVEVSGIDPPP
jgi:mannose-1-phosphate guanylyltransferase